MSDSARWLVLVPTEHTLSTLVAAPHTTRTPRRMSDIMYSDRSSVLALMLHYNYLPTVSAQKKNLAVPSSASIGVCTVHAFSCTG